MEPLKRINPADPILRQFRDIVDQLGAKDFDSYVAASNLLVISCRVSLVPVVLVAGPGDANGEAQEIARAIHPDAAAWDQQTKEGVTVCVPAKY